MGETTSDPSDGGNVDGGTVPYELRYTLPWRWTLAPHLRLWGPLGLFYGGAAVLLLALPCTHLRLALPAAGVLLVLAWVGRNFFRGIVNGLRRGGIEMDLRVEENGLGYLMGGERCWIFLDGIRRIEQLRKGLWTIVHFNGTVIHVPAESISPAQLAHLRAAAARGKTPEGVQAVIERGRALMKQEQDKEP